jgi:hypothetical protein
MSRILIIELGGARLTQVAYDAARAEVQAKMQAVRNGSTAARSQRLNQQQVNTLKATDLPVYLIARSDAKSVSPLLSIYGHQGQVNDVLKDIRAEYGAAVPDAKRPVAFVTTNFFDSQLLTGPYSDDEKQKREKWAGRAMAQVILHEVGHLLGVVKHQKGPNNIMMAKLLFDADKDPRNYQFNKDTKQQLVQRINNLVNQAAKP